ncbi:response regulator [Chitinophaga deserti]|uniref:response regulator n=1 Tax=Chitinophaga deserti TaxID=2164099 RepID=UPI000D6C594F|nr:response regulator transcription factor [Chitinophaga deserti]
MIRIVLYEDNTKLRENLTLLIDGAQNFVVCGAFRNCDNILQQMDDLLPDVLLMDIDMPGTNGIEGLRMVRSRYPNLPILMLTVFDDNQHVFEAIKAGADGYLLKKTPPDKLLDYLQDVYDGGAPMTSSIARQVLQLFARQPSDRNEMYNLSDREKEVLQLLVNGYSYKMIASEIFISIDTVRSHIKKIYEKLHVNSKSEAVAKAFRDKLV